MALNQQDINVGAAPNDGQGDPIRTAFIKCNDNFTQLYSLPNPNPPTTLVGAPGDMPGMYAYDDTYFYYCYASYNGNTTIWGQLVQSDEAIPSIGNGNSNVVIAFPNNPVTVSVNGTSNVAVFANTGLTVRGTTTSNTLVGGNITISGNLISGDGQDGQTITITPANDMIFRNIVANASLSIQGPTTTTESQRIIIANLAANLTAANGAGIQIGNADYAHLTFDSTANRWSAYPRLETPNLFIDATTPGTGNIFGAFNISASNTTYSGNFVGNTFNAAVLMGTPELFAGNVYANRLHGDGGFISNVQGANVTGVVPLADVANVANFAYNSLGNSAYANVAGTVANTNQPNITQVGVLNSLTVSGGTALGNATTGQFVIGSGVITAPFIGTHGNTLLRGTIGANSSSQPNITQLGTLTNVFVNGDSTFYGNLGVVGNLFAGNLFGNVTANTRFSEFVISNNQPNITSVGNMIGLEVANVTFYGDIVGNQSPVANTTIISRNMLANVMGYITGGVGTSLRGTLSVGSNAQPNITSLGTLVSLAVNSAISTNTLSTTGNVSIGGNLTVAGNITFTGNIQEISGNSGQFFGNNSTGFGALYAGVVGYGNVPNSPFETVTNSDSYSQLAIQNVNPGAKASGDLVITADNGDDLNNYINLGITSSTWDGSEPNSLGNAVGRTDGYLGMQGGIGTGGNLIIGTTTTGKAVRFVVGGAGNTNVAVALSGVNTVSNSTTSGTMVVFGGCGITGNLNANLINSVGNISAPSFNWSNGSPLISSSGNLDAAFINVTGNVTAGGNVNGTYFNGIAITSQYADLAENYLADEAYAPGTVLSHGGPAEVTISLVDADPLVIGVVSSNPAYLMNGKLAGRTVVPVAFTGRIPCRVQGPITRGAMLVSNGDGRARAESNPAIGTVIGKALESFDGDLGVIEIVVGKL